MGPFRRPLGRQILFATRHVLRQRRVFLSVPWMVQNGMAAPVVQLRPHRSCTTHNVWPTANQVQVIQGHPERPRVTLGLGIGYVVSRNKLMTLRTELSKNIGRRLAREGPCELRITSCDELRFQLLSPFDITRRVRAH